MIDLDVDELFATCRTAFRRSDGATALDNLGYRDLLCDLSDAVSRRMVMAVFEAQGYELASSPALSGLLGAPYAELLDGQVHATAWSRRSRGGGYRHLIVGPVPEGPLVVDSPGEGAIVVGASQLELRPLDLPGRMFLHEVDVSDVRPDERLGEEIIGPVRQQGLRLGRLALAFEMLGAARVALELATEHARSREQFGQPIGGFQAVQHILAWALTDCESLAAVAAHALLLDPQLPDGMELVPKALAGRNAMSVCERSLQVLGAIGFTAEHDHHHSHSRVLALDALLGTGSELTHQVGERWRTNPVDRRIPAAILGAAHC